MKFYQNIVDNMQASWTGTEGDNTFYSAPNPELFDGLGGKDTVVYPGARADYSLSVLPNRNVQVTGNTPAAAQNGSDVLHNIERLRFSDSEINLSTPPETTDVTPTPPKTPDGTPTGVNAQYIIAAASASKPDGTTGTTPYSFTVTRSGDASKAATLGYSVFGSGGNPAPGYMFVAAGGTVSLSAGATTATVTVDVRAARLTSSEGFTVALSSPDGTSITTAAASGIIGANSAAPALGLKDIAVTGSHDQYLVVDNPGGTALIRDTVPGRDGDRTVQDLQHVIFSDGVGVMDPTGNAESITRLYQAALNRSPDQGGLDLFTHALSVGAVSLASLASTFTSSPEFINAYGTLDNTGFVTQLYQNVLHRAPDAAGAQNFVNVLNNGGSRPDALVSIANSPENRVNLRPITGDRNDGEAARLYQAGLNRAPDGGGLSLFSTALANGATPEQIAHGFVTSTEFSNNYGALTNPADFVAQLYANVLHRAPDAAGQQVFVNALNSGASRESVLLGFSDSTENRLNTATLTHDSWVFLRS